MRIRPHLPRSGCSVGAARQCCRLRTEPSDKMPVLGLGDRWPASDNHWPLADLLRTRSGIQVYRPRGVIPSCRCRGRSGGFGTGAHACRCSSASSPDTSRAPIPMATTTVARVINQGSICPRTEAHDTATTRSPFPARPGLDRTLRHQGSRGRRAGRLPGPWHSRPRNSCRGGLAGTASVTGKRAPHQHLLDPVPRLAHHRVHAGNAYLPVARSPLARMTYLAAAHSGTRLGLIGRWLSAGTGYTLGDSGRSGVVGMGGVSRPPRQAQQAARVLPRGSGRVRTSALVRNGMDERLARDSAALKGSSRTRGSWIRRGLEVLRWVTTGLSPIRGHRPPGRSQGG
jgi:hypothetical protein